MTFLRCLLFAFLVVQIPLAMARKHDASNVNVPAMVDHAKAMVANGRVDPQRDLGPLLDRLATSHDESELDALISGIEDMGQYDGASPAAVKTYLRETAPPALLAVAGSSNAPWSTRGSALLALRSLNVSDQVLDQAIALAEADTSADKKLIRFRGELLANWKKSRPAAAAAPASVIAPAHADREQPALEFLRQHHERVSADGLGQAALHGRTEVVTALLDAGVDVNSIVGGGMTALDYAATGCMESNDDLAARLTTIDVLLLRHADVARHDSRGNTVLMSAVQICSLPVVEKLVEGGAKVDPMNAQGFTPLQMAFVSNKWDIATFLVGHGARVSRKAMDQLFFEKPTDPAKLALIKRATAN